METRSARKRMYAAMEAAVALHDAPAPAPKPASVMLTAEDKRIGALLLRKLRHLRLTDEHFLAYAHFIAAHAHVVDTGLAKNALSPSPQVDAVWHAHLLYTRHYADFCARLAKRYVHHDAERARDANRLKHARYAHTLRLLDEHVAPLEEGEERNAKIWPAADMLYPTLSMRVLESDLVGCDGAPKTKIVYDMAESLEAVKAARASADQIFVKTPTGKSLTVRAFASDSVLLLKHLIREHEGIDEEDQRLIFGGTQLEDDATLESYGLGDWCTVHLVLRLRGC